MIKKFYRLFLLVSMPFFLSSSYIKNGQMPIRSLVQRKLIFDDCVITDISAGTSHNLALDSNGNLWAWGDNDYGQLGDGTKVNSSVPKQIMVGHKFKQISAGNDYSAAIDENGYLYGWGSDRNPTKTNQLTPTIVNGENTYSYINSGYNQCFSIKSTQTQTKPFGFGYSKFFYDFPVILDSNRVELMYGEIKTHNKKIIDADSNYEFSDYGGLSSYDFVVLEDGTLEKYIKVRSDAHYIFFDSNIDVSNLSNIIDVSCRKVYKQSNTMFSTVYFLDKSGQIYSVGHNGFDNMLGSSSTLSAIQTLTPVQVDPVNKFTKISAGENHVLALSEDGGVFSWGNNGFGQLGIGNLTSQKTPVRVNTFDIVKSINITAYPGEKYQDSLAQETGNSYSIVQQPKKGTLTVDHDTGSFEYLAYPTEYGYDTAIVGMHYDMNYVEYQVNIFIDRKPFISTGNLNINVDYLSSYSGRIPVSDSDGDRLKFSIHQYPSKGNLVIDSESGRYTYTSKKDCAGQDEFIINVSDGYYTLQVPLSVHIETKITTNDKTEIYLDNTNATSYSGNMNASDLDGDKITYSITGQPSKGNITVDNLGNYKYTPSIGEYGQDTFTLQATDGKTPINLTYNVELYQIKDNNTDLDIKIPAGSELNNKIIVDAKNCNPIYSIKSDGAKGNVTINKDTGEYTYVPKPNSYGADQFVVNVNYGYGNFDLTIKVYQNTPSNISEVLTNISTKENVTYKGTVTASDIDGDSLRYKVVTFPRLGRIDLNELTGEYTYYPSNNTAGKDSVDIEVTDGINVTPIKLQIKIESEINVKEKISSIINQNTSLTGNVNANDKDGDILDYKLLISPTNGSASVDSKTGEYTYLPNNGYYGKDTFTIQITDGTAPKNVIVDVFVNRKPTSEAIEYNLIANGNSVSGSTKCIDPDGDTLSYSLSLEPKMGKVILDKNSGNFSYVPNIGAKGNDTFTVTATDGYDNVNVVVNVHNETELVLEEQETNIIVNQGKSTNGKVLALDLDGDTLSYKLSIMPTQGFIEINEQTGAWTYTATKKATGTDSFSVKVTDGNTTKELVYKLIINTPSEFDSETSNSFETNKNTSYNGIVKATDANGDAITYSVVRQGQKGNVTIDPSSGRYIYIPNKNASGNDSFVVGANDGNFMTELVINVHIETEVKVKEGTQTVSLDKDGIITGVTNAYDEDGDELTYKIFQNGAKGNANVTQDGSWSYFANNGAGQDSFIIEVTDGKSKAYLTVYLHIDSVPKFESNAINITVGKGQSASGSAAAYDEDGDTLEYKIITEPENGTVNLNSETGEFTFNSHSNATSDKDKFVIAVTDGKTTKELQVNVLLNNGPIGENSDIKVEQNGSVKGTLIASDPEGDKLTYTIGSQGTYGNVVINSETGEYTYTTNNKNYSGNDAFTVLVTDGYTTQEITISVEIIKNKAPSSSTAYIGLESGTSVEGILEVIDEEGDNLSFSISQQGDKGNATINEATGEFTYSARPDTQGYDCFVVTVSDGYHSKSFLVEVGITFVDSYNSWAIPTVAVTSSIALVSLIASTFVIVSKKKKKNK